MAASTIRNTIRFTGLASGMDTESIVKAMLTAEQNKIDKQVKKQQLYTWKQDAWKEMNKKINTFSEKYVDKLRMQSTFIKTKATISNDKALSVSESSNIGNGIHKVEIKQLATSAYMQTAKANVDVKKIDDQTTLKELGLSENTTLSINSKDIVLSTDLTLKEVNDALASENISIKLPIEGNKISLTYNKPSGSQASDELEIKVADDKSTFFSKLGFSGTSMTLKAGQEVTGSQLRETALSSQSKLGNLLDSNGNPLVTGNSPITLDVNGTEVKLTASDTIQDMINKMKSADKNLSVSYDSDNKQFFVTSTTTGKESQTKITNKDGGEEFLKALGLVHQGGDTLEGQNALYSYNGMGNTTVDGKQYFESSSNNVKINGLEMTLKEVTTEPVTIQGSTDTSEMVAFMKEFVSEYNKLMEEINTKLTTKTSSKYEPLTDAEKEATSDKNVEKIENYVKDGLFYRDSDLMQIRDSLRDTMSGVVNGNEQYKTLSSIGITTGNWREQGKLYFDEEKFTKALQENPDDVINLFAGSGNSTEAVKEYMKQHNVTEKEAQEAYNKLDSQEKQKYLTSSQGIFTRINSNLSSLSKSSELKSYGSYYNDKVLLNDLRDIADRISTLNEKYNTKETALYKKFTAMEKMMSQLNSQQSYLTSMVSA